MPTSINSPKPANPPKTLPPKEQAPQSSANAFIGICLCLAVAVVCWDTWRRSSIEHDRAKGLAQSYAIGIEACLNRSFSAVDALAVLVRQSGGRVSDFQTVGSELASSSPGIVSLEIQPGGVTTDVVPRTGNEKAIGHNAMRDPAALMAIQTRKRILTGPLTLPQGYLGVVGRLPVVVRDAKGKEFFWGFVSSSVKLGEILGQAKLAGLAAKGYDYSLVALPAASTNSIPITQQGSSDASNSAVQTLSMPTLQFQLAVRPQGGWIRKFPLVIESLLVIMLGFLGRLYLQAQKMNAQLQYTLADGSERIAMETQHAMQLEEQLREVTAAGAEELRSAREAAEAMRARMVAVEKQVQLGQERSSQIEAELRLAKETGAAMLGSARKTAETLQSGLREAQLQLIQGQEERDKLKQELENTQKHASLELLNAQKARESLLALFNETKAELERNRAQLAQVEAEFKKTVAHEQQAEKDHVDLEAKVEQWKEDQAHSAIDLPPENLPPSAESQEPEAVTEVAPTVPPAVVSPSLIDQGPASVIVPADSVPAFEIPANSELKDSEEVWPQDSEIEPVETSIESSPEETIEQTIEPSIEPVVEPVVESVPKPLPEPEPDSTVPPKPEKTIRRKKTDSAQLSLFDVPAESKEDSVVASKLTPSPLPQKPRAASSNILNRSAFKKDASELSMLLAESDPGAKECLSDYHEILRPAFTPEVFEEFEQNVKNSSYHAALILLVKTARRHGINL